MSNEFQYEPDRYWFPFALTSSDNQLVLEEQTEGTVTTVTLTARQRYYHHRDTSEDGQIGYAWQQELEDALNAQLTGTYAVSEGTPQGSSLVNSGLVVTRTDGDFDWRFDHGDWTLDRRLLGYDVDRTAPLQLASGAVSPYSILTTWDSFNLIDGKATHKLPERDKHTGLSTDRVTSAAARRFYDDKYRPIEYPYVPGAHVRENRALDQRSAQTAELPEGDRHNTIEGQFDLFTARTDDYQIVQCILGHGQRGNTYDDVYGQPYEVARLANNDEQLSKPNALYTQQRMAGEYYRVRWRWMIEMGTYTQ